MVQVSPSSTFLPGSQPRKSASSTSASSSSSSPSSSSQATSNSFSSSSQVNTTLLPSRPVLLTSLSLSSPSSSLTSKVIEFSMPVKLRLSFEGRPSPAAS